MPSSCRSKDCRNATPQKFELYAIALCILFNLLPCLPVDVTIYTAPLPRGPLLQLDALTTSFLPCALGWLPHYTNMVDSGKRKRSSSVRETAQVKWHSPSPSPTPSNTSPAAPDIPTSFDYARPLPTLPELQEPDLPKEWYQSIAER